MKTSAMARSYFRAMALVACFCSQLCCFLLAYIKASVYARSASGVNARLFVMEAPKKKVQQIDAAGRLMEVLDGFFKGVQGDMWLLIGKNGLRKANSGEIVYSKVLEARLRSRAAKRKGYPQKN